MKTIVAISSTGVGKSSLGNTITGGENFSVSSESASETKETIGVTGTFKGLQVHFIDTPGLNDSDGMDSLHVKKMIDYLKNQKEINGVQICINYQDPRASSSLMAMLKLLCYIFRSSEFPRSVCLVFTKCIRVKDEVVLQKTQEFSKKFQDLMTQTGLQVGTNPIPCFFINNGSNSDKNETELTKIKDWFAGLSALRTDLLNHADPQFEKFEEETREIVDKTDRMPILEQRQKSYQVEVPHEVWAGDLGKIFGKKKTVMRNETRYTTETVQTGTKVIKFFVSQKRLKKTTYAGKEVFTEWENVSQRQEEFLE